MQKKRTELRNVELLRIPILVSLLRADVACLLFAWSTVRGFIVL